MGEESRAQAEGWDHTSKTWRGVSPSLSTFLAVLFQLLLFSLSTAGWDVQPGNTSSFGPFLTNPSCSEPAQTPFSQTAAPATPQHSCSVHGCTHPNLQLASPGLSEELQQDVGSAGPNHPQFPSKEPGRCCCPSSKPELLPLYLCCVLSASLNTNSSPIATAASVSGSFSAPDHLPDDVPTLSPRERVEPPGC